MIQKKEALDLVRHFVGLARVSQHLGLDARASGGERDGEWWFGKAAGYMAAARSVRGVVLSIENEGFARKSDRSTELQ